MKKVLFLLLCAACILFMTAALGETADATLASDNATFGMIQSACELKGAVYFLSNKGIYRWTPGPGAPEMLTDLSLIQGFGLSPTPPKSTVERELWEQGMSYLFTDGETLYGLHPYTGQVFVLQDEIMAPFARIPQDQFFYTDQENLLPKEIKSLVFANGKLYLMLKSFTAKQGDSRELFSWDLHSGAMQLLNAPGAQAVFPGSRGGLLVRVSPDKEQSQNQADQPRPTLWLYEPASQAYTQMVWDETVSSAAGSVWREEDGTLYFLDDGGKVVKALPGGKTQVKAYLPISFADAESQAFLLKNGAYVYIKAGSLFVRDISQNGEKQVKTVHVAGYMDPTITIAFSAKHPDISLILDSDVTDFLSIQQSMVSGNSDIDLYIVNSADAYQDIREKGYAAPMNGNALLLDQAKQFYPVLRDALFAGDKLLAFPLNLLPDTWTVNRTVWDRLGLGEYPLTFESFFKAVETWDEKYAMDNPDYMLLESHEGFLGFAALIVKQYLLQHETEEAPVSFNDPAFRSAAQAALDHRESLDNQLEGPNPIIMTYSQYLGVGYNDSDEVVSIPPPALTENSPRMVKASMDLFVLNPLSKNQQSALDFVAFYAGQMSPTTQYALNETLNTPLRRTGFESSQRELKDRIAQLEVLLDKASPEEKSNVQALIDEAKKRYDLREKEDWLITKESIDIYRNLAKNLTVPLHSIFANDRGSQGDEAIEQVIRRFAGGQLTVDQFISELDSKALMMFREGK
jgi:hypothetical protein